ncbi:hypothetical protein B0H15DRAFT_942022 [Mycena belliarum]|uniref:Uncharacterized protein n=1 Tax=Mycena belliarum TaxID=1033014 RepID=A0AAD6UI16_9AGAR|nr:hypothetical protein B0H15DRAFT_942022 [Mycena belliae]
MANFPFASPGTEPSDSVPGAAPPPGGDAVAALQSFFNAALLSWSPPAVPPVVAPVVAPIVAAPAPAPVVAAPAPVVATPVPAHTLHSGFLTWGPWVAGALYQVTPAGPLALIAEADLVPNEDPPLWYCITRGRYVGVTLNHALALAAVTGVPRNSMKSYKSQLQAVDAFNDMLQYHMVAVLN